jgi:hypothetical protein
MPLNESSATALVRITGLAIVCFNAEQRRGEVALVRDYNHSLSLCLQRPAFQEGGGDHILYQDIASYNSLPKQGVRIEIKASGAGAAEGFEIYRSGEEFDRLDSPDPQDFRWIVHMDSQLHGGVRLRPTGRGRYPLTPFYISGGRFYTHKLDTELFFEKVEKDSAGQVLRREPFGNVGETVGVALGGEEVVFKIDIGGREETHTLRRVEGLPYRVLLRNMDHSPNAVYSDMPDYYSYLASPDGRAFDFAPVDEEEGPAAEGGSVNYKEYCHPVATDLASIDQL